MAKSGELDAPSSSGGAVSALGLGQRVGWFLLLSLVMLALCWFGSQAVFRTLFGTFEFDKPPENRVFGDIISVFFVWCANALLATAGWVASWLAGVLALTSLHRLLGRNDDEIGGLGGFGHREGFDRSAVSDDLHKQ